MTTIYNRKIQVKGVLIIYVDSNHLINIAFCSEQNVYHNMLVTSYSLFEREKNILFIYNIINLYNGIKIKKYNIRYTHVS